MNTVFSIGTCFKAALTRLGRYVPKQFIHNLNAALNYLEVGRWMHERGFKSFPRVRERESVYDMMAAMTGGKRVLYLELGVFEGEAMHYWSKLLTDPSSHLHGFDSFEGLPENWNLSNVKGTFSTGGKAPAIPDQRIKFFKGWFDETLKSYTPPDFDQLIINCDADLYDSTVCVLEKFKKNILPGTIIYFDEFSDRNHELRAFSEFLDKTKLKFEVIASNRELSRVAFRCIG